jgi:YVTN family beta-propeller protein
MKQRRRILQAAAAMLACCGAVHADSLLVLNLLVLNKDGSVAIVDPVNANVTAKITAGDGPHEIVAAGHDLAVISNYQGRGQTLAIVDLKAHKELRRVDISPASHPHGLALFRDKIYFTAEGSSTIGRYDPIGNRVEWTLPTGQSGTHMILLNRDGTKIFTTNLGSGSVSIFEQSGEKWNPTHIKVGPRAEGFDLSPDEKEIWAANAGDGTVSIIDVPSKKVIATVNVGTQQSNRLKFTPDGKRVLISDFNTGEVAVVDASAKKVVKRIKIASSVAGILVAPDGARAYVAATYDGFVAIIDMATLSVTNKIATGRGPDGMDWIRGN